MVMLKTTKTKKYDGRRVDKKRNQEKRRGDERRGEETRESPIANGGEGGNLI